MGKSRKRSNAQRLVADDKKSRPNDDGGTSGPSNSEPAPAQVSEQQQVPRAPSFPVASSTLQNWIKQVFIRRPARTRSWLSLCCSTCTRRS